MDKKYVVEMFVKEKGKGKWVDCSAPTTSYEDCWSTKIRIKLNHKGLRLRISEVKNGTNRV